MGSVKRFAPATKKDARLRLALCGPAGSGKTFTALRIAAGLGGRIAVIDTEHGSAAKYADVFTFDSAELTDHSPKAYSQAIRDAAAERYDVLVIDSLSHAWMGTGGALEMVDLIIAKGGSSKNSFAAWRFVTPEHNALVEAILASGCHVIATLRTKTEWVVEQNDRGKAEPRKVGTAPIQRDGVEYEFDLVAELRLDNALVVTKTRCAALNQAVLTPATEDLGVQLRDWLKPQTERRHVPPVGQPPCRRDEGSGTFDEPPPPTEPLGEPPGEAPDLPPPDPQVGRLAREGLIEKLRELVRIVGSGAAAERLRREGFGPLSGAKTWAPSAVEKAVDVLTRAVEEREAAQRLLEEQREQATAEQQRRLEAAVAKTTEHKEKVDFEARAAAMAAKARTA